MTKTWEDFLKPILEITKNNQNWNRNELVEEVAKKVGITQEERNEVLANSLQKRYVNRIGWAICRLHVAGLMQNIERSIWKITMEGINFNNQHEVIRKSDLYEIPKYRVWKELTKKNSENNKNDICLPTTTNNEQTSLTPEESINCACSEIDSKIKNDLLMKLCSVNPYDFEKICIKLLSKIYGISEEKFLIVTQKAHDKGIDGIIQLDHLGFDKIYIQAKRYSENKITDKNIREFVGALSQQQAKKGLFMTTSEFTHEATSAAKKNSDFNIVLMGGIKMVELMIENKIGVEIHKTIKIYKISNDFFDEISSGD